MNAVFFGSLNLSVLQVVEQAGPVLLLLAMVVVMVVPDIAAGSRSRLWFTAADEQAAGTYDETNDNKCHHDQVKDGMGFLLGGKTVLFHFGREVTLFFRLTAASRALF